MNYRLLAKDEKNLYEGVIEKHKNNFCNASIDYMTSCVYALYMKDKGFPLGFMVLEKKTIDELCVHLIFIFGTFRRYGAGSSLLKVIKRDFKERIIYGFCPIENEEAIKFFIANDVKFLSRDRKSQVTPNKYRTNVYVNEATNSIQFFLRCDYDND